MFHAPTSTLERSPTPNPQNWNRGETPPEPTGRTVSARLINNLLMAAEQQGCDGNALLQRSGIAPIDVLRGNARIATSSYARLQRHAMRAMEDESLGCMPGRQHLGTWAMVCRSVIQCSRLGHALGRMFKHYALFEWSLHCHIETDGDECIIHVAPREGASFQYELRAYEMVLREAEVRISMDGRGRWMDNVFIERLWRSLKYECVYLHAFETGSELRAGLGRWITYYNTQRPHSGLAGRTPVEVYRRIGQSDHGGHAPHDLMIKQAA